MRQVWAGKQSTVFQVLGGTIPAYLKVGPALHDERDRLEWLEGRLPVARVLSYGRGASIDWLLLTAVTGLELANLKHTEPPSRILELLAEALHVVHATPVDGCPFGDPSGTVLTHGDACLPNFLFDHGGLTGVVDVGDAGRGSPEVDLAAAVGSIHYNLGPGLASAFLDAYGFDIDESGFTLALDDQGRETLRRVNGTVAS